jgi:hypothetical protein
MERKHQIENDPKARKRTDKGEEGKTIYLSPENRENYLKFGDSKHDGLLVAYEIRAAI